jgi:hypothetical protein
MEASRGQTASVVIVAGSVERPRLERSNSARLAPWSRSKSNPPRQSGYWKQDNVVPTTSARQGISLEPNTIAPRVYPSVFPGVADLNRRLPLRQSDVAPHRHSLGQ